MSSSIAATDEQTDEMLLVAIANGSDRQMLIVIERHLPAILALARRMVGAEWAEDIAQETMVRLWQKAEVLEIDERGLRPWLYRVASNLCLDHLRKRREITGTDMSEQPVDPVQDHEMNERNMTKTVSDAITRLPPRQGLAMRLFHLQDLNQRETADVMGVSEDALESLLRRGRAGLKKQLNDNWQDLIPKANDE